MCQIPLVLSCVRVLDVGVLGEKSSFFLSRSGLALTCLKVCFTSASVVRGGDSWQGFRGQRL